MTNYATKNELQRAFIDFGRSVEWKNPFAITLTMKQRVEGRPIDPVLASTNFRHFMNRLNRHVFGNSTKRHRKRLTTVAVLEHDELVRFHYHAAIDCPETIDPAEFKTAIKNSWHKTLWGHDQIDIKPITNDGWLSYMAKFDQKANYDLSIDWMNVHTCQPT